MRVEHDCESFVIGPCLTCGAPQCCAICCQENDLVKRLLSTWRVDHRGNRYRDADKVEAADRITELESKVHELAMSYLALDQQQQEALDENQRLRRDLEAALCKLREQRDMERDGIAVREVE